MTPHGQFHWNELMTRDVDGAKAFYGDSVGWTFDDVPMPEGTYTVCMNGEWPAAGIFNMNDANEMPADMPPHWFPYLAVDDIDARVAKAKANGATIMREPFDVPGVGRICILQQPDGAAIGWMTPAPMENG